MLVMANRTSRNFDDDARCQGQRGTGGRGEGGTSDGQHFLPLPLCPSHPSALASLRAKRANLQSRGASTGWKVLAKYLLLVVLSACMTACGGANEEDVALITGTPVTDPDPSPTTPAGALGTVTSTSRISFQAGAQIELEMFDELGRCLLNVTNEVLALAGDFRGRAVPAGTIVAFFVANGRGIIERQAETDSTGIATATFRSLCPSNARDPIITVAAVRGAEPFTDLNSNSRRDANEPFTDLDREAFLDANRDGVYQPSLGEYLIWDPNNNGRYDAGGNGVYDTDNIIVDEAFILPVQKGRTPTPTIGTPGSETPGTPGTPTTPPNPGTPTPTATPSVVPAFLQVALFSNQASDNNDGTLSSVVTAQVSDGNGVALDDVSVEFRILPPVQSGMSVTSPVLSGARLNCRLDFNVPDQPGNALSCLKYDATLQGQMIAVEARVMGASGPLISSQSILLPDIRPVINTPVPTTTGTVTATPKRVPKTLRVAQYNNLSSTNTDGTYSAALTAIVGDKDGVAIDNLFVNFRILPPIIPGVIVTSPGVTGGPLPCVLMFPPPIPPPPPQPGDALTCIKFDSALQGRIVEVEASVDTPDGPLVDSVRVHLPVVGVASQENARSIQIPSFTGRGSDNNDGTFSSALAAVVADGNGVALDGLNVQFRILPPVPSGVVMTSPTLTGAELPCSLSGVIINPQPGAALTCLKYDGSLGGQSITVEARVSRLIGDLVATQNIILPDFRIPTKSPTPTSSATRPIEDATSTPTGTTTASVTPTPPASSVQFVSAEPAQIGVRQSGRPEQSTMTFLVTDAFGNPIPNVDVYFQLSGIGGESLSLTKAQTSSTGTVSTVLTSGTRAAPVRITAGADVNSDGSPDVFAQSTQIAVLGGPPAQNRFSVGVERRNIAGRVQLGLRNEISAFVNDRFGNAVPAGTAVTFVSNGASVVNPTATNEDGIATATLLSEADIPPSGIVTVMAFTRGEEAFRDTNGDGVFQSGLDQIINDNRPEPYVDYRPLPEELADVAPDDGICPIAPPSSLCNNLFDPTQHFEIFVDGDRNGLWNSQGQSGVWDSNVLVSSTVAVTFSGPLAPPTVSAPTFAIPDGGSLVMKLQVHDDLRNPLVAGSRISVSTTLGFLLPSAFVVGDGHSFNQIVPGLTEFEFILGDLVPGDIFPTPEPSSVVVLVESPNGTQSFIVATGTID